MAFYEQRDTAGNGMREDNPAAGMADGIHRADGSKKPAWETFREQAARWGRKAPG